MADSGDLLRRLERTALVLCLAMAAGAVVVRGGRLDVALGVLGGGLIVGVSYWGVKAGIDGVLALIGPAPGPRPGEAPTGRPRRRTPLGVMLRIVVRYGLIGAVAYVLVAVVRLNPVGLLIGASSAVAAAAFEAARLMGGSRRS